MDKKSEEELERIANLITAEMVRNLNAPAADTPDAPSEDEGSKEPDED